MMEGFLDQLPIQFYLLACGLPLAMVALIAAWVYTSRNQQQNEIQKQKEALALAGTGNATTTMNADASPPKTDRFVQSTTADFDSFDDEDDFDPLAELREARESSDTESSQTADDIDIDDVSLRDLLAGMDDEADSEYRTIADQPVRVKLSTDDDAQATELLSILRDEDDGRLMVLFDETAYRTLVDAPDAKKKFTRIMKELSTVVLKPDDRKPEPEPEPEPELPPTVSTEPEPEPASHPPAVVDGTPDNADDTPLPTLAETDDDDEIPGLLPDYSLGDSDEIYERGRFGRVKVKEPQDDIPELNIPEAINQYLQYKISKTPEFQDSGIQIRPSHTGGVIIFVGENRYEFVDDIEDDNARAFIKGAINEWQERN